MTDRRAKINMRSGPKWTLGTEALHVRLLGGFSVSAGNRTIEQNEWRLRKPASLVKLLALAPGNKLHREQVMDMLWPDLGRTAASNNLRQALHAARRAIGPDPLVGSRFLASQEQSIALSLEGQLWVDTRTDTPVRPRDARGE